MQSFVVTAGDAHETLNFFVESAPSERDSFPLAREFIRKMEDAVAPERISVEPDEVQDASDDEIHLQNFQDPNEKKPSSLTEGMLKRLAEVEKKLKKRDDADEQKANTYPTFKTTGFLQLDTAYYAQSQKNINTVGDAQDGTGFRRARFAVAGKVAEFTTYQLVVDFATARRAKLFRQLC